MYSWYFKQQEWYQHLKKMAGFAEDFVRNSLKFIGEVIDSIGIPKIIKNAIFSLFSFWQNDQDSGNNN
jgi:hypothetical protein